MLIHSEEVGPCLIEDPAHRAFYMFNHLEYDSTTLKEEYDRDLAGGGPIAAPVDYFPDDDPARPPENRWRSHGQLLYGNWINEIYQTTPYELDGDRRLTAAMRLSRRRGAARRLPRRRDPSIVGRRARSTTCAPAAARRSCCCTAPAATCATGPSAPPTPSRERHEVIAFDRPGLGFSGRPAAAPTSVWRLQAALLRGALARLGVARATLVGHSFGGAVALAWALEAPETVAGLLLARRAEPAAAAAPG